MKYQEVISHLKEQQYKWLITGAAGFIGSNILEELLNLNQKIIGIDNFSTGKIENIHDALNKNPNFIENFNFFEGDISDFKLCKKASDGVDFILHQAARGSVIKSIEDPISTNKANVDGFLNILQAGCENKVKKFVYASSSSVYGDQKDLPKIEHSIGKPLSPYAITKLTNELYAKNFSELYSIETVGLRYFNVFGKRQDPSGDYAAVIPKWVNSLLNQQPIFVHGDGKTSRDFCFIHNVVQVNILSAINKGKNISEVYNVACGQQTSLNDLINILKMNIYGTQDDLQDKVSVFYKDFRKGDVRHSLADISKAIDQLNYNPNYDIQSGIKLYIEWFKEK